MDEVKLKPGWLQRQFDNINKDFKRWPKWMKEAYKLNDKTTKASIRISQKV